MAEMPSVTEDGTTVDHWLHIAKHGELIMDGIFSVTSPQLYLHAREMMRAIKAGDYNINKFDQYAEQIGEWPSSFSGIAIICNRKTKAHTDTNGDLKWYDYLLSLGSHSMQAGRENRTFLELDQIGAKLSYAPGTVIALSGKLLKHAVRTWDTEDRVCFAHFIRDKIHAKTGLEKPSWVEFTDYSNDMEQGFLHRLLKDAGFEIM